MSDAAKPADVAYEHIALLSLRGLVATLTMDLTRIKLPQYQRRNLIKQLTHATNYLNWLTEQHEPNCQRCNFLKGGNNG